MPLLSAEELEAKLSEIVQRLRAAFSPVAIYLFGSYVYGTPNRHSDLDLPVVVEESQCSAYARDAQAYRALSGLGISKDVMVYTRAEFEQRSSLPVSFERTVKKKKGASCSMPPERREIRAWLEKASHDALAATMALTLTPPLADIAAFGL